MKNLNLLFGADPEYFAKTSWGVISPALLEKFSGMKRIDGDDKHPIFVDTNSHIWMGDGVAFELTLKKPYDNFNDMYKTIENSLDNLANFLTRYKFMGEDLELNTEPVIGITHDLYTPYLKEDAIKMGYIYGCDEDYDASDLNYSCKTRDASKDNFRYGGGHIHISSPELSNLYERFPKIAIRLMACTVGNYVIAHSKCPEKELQRIGVYGRPERYRPQHYKNNLHGVEYRTPSNQWTTFSDDKIEGLEYWIRTSAELFQRGSTGDKAVVEILRRMLPRSKKAINSVNQRSCKRILTEIKGIM